MRFASAPTGRSAARCSPSARSASATACASTYLWLSAGDGVHCHAPDGTLLGKVLIPESVANLCFGGAKRNRMFICGTTSLYSVYLNTRGAR